MFNHNRFKLLTGVGLYIGALISCVAQELTIEQATQIALQNDPVLKMKQAESRALAERAMADKSLPDPRIALGLLNYPTDTFARDQEPMTQTRIALQQVLPRGDSLDIRSSRTRNASEMQLAFAQLQQRKLVLLVRQTYLEAVYWARAERVLKKNIKLFQTLIKTTESSYASGRQAQQDVIRAELELDMLYDRMDGIVNEQQQIQAKLQQLLGQSVPFFISAQTPQLPEFMLDNTQTERFEQHPTLEVQRKKIMDSDLGIEMAQQAYKPAWMFELAYAFRDGSNANGSQRADFASAMVSFDLPIFTRNNQDRQVAASRFQKQAVEQAYEEQLRNLTNEYEKNKSIWLQTQTRLQRFTSSIIPQSIENSKAALLAYQNRRGDFASLMRARITELETSLKQLRLEINHLKAQAKLLYLVGEQQ